MRLKKNILSARKYFSPDGEVDVTPDRIKHWSDQFRGMTEAGHKIPVAWDHSDKLEEMVPIKDSPGSKSAADNVAILESFEPSEDGNSVDIVLNFKDEEAAKSADRNLVGVSPVILNNWTDGEKNDWNDVVTHVDLVRHPVDNHQSEFIACSLRMGLDDKVEEYSVKRMSDTAGTAKSPEGQLDAKAKEGEGAGVPVKPSTLDAVIENLAKIDVVLPDGTDANNFFDRFNAALATRVAMEENEMEDDATVVAQMGLEKDKSDKPTPEQLYVQKLHQKTVGQRLSTLLENGQISPKEYEEKEKEVPALRMSLNAEGEHAPTNLEVWIEAREAMPTGHYFTDEQKTKHRMSLDQVAPHPSSITGEETPESVEAVLSDIYGESK